MAETLYRKYRPQRFADVAEQYHVIRTLQNQLAAGTVAHAYLFSGPRGVGKTTLARLLAKAVNCEARKAGENEPCNACSACIEFAEGRYIDTVEMDAASNTGVDNVRENVIENVRFVPQRGKFKVFVIDEVHMLSTSAFNALLKTLEEPPAHAMFILATTELHKIPATIISRCQRFDFHRIPVQEMVTRLQGIAAQEKVKIDDDVLTSIARLSEGCLRDAESLLGQVFAVGGEKITLETASLVLPQTNIALVGEVIDAVSGNDVPTALQKLTSFVEEGGAVRHLTDEMIEYVRTMLFLLLGSPSDAYDTKTMETLQASAGRLSAADARRLLDLLLVARSRTSLMLLPQLPLELALVEFSLGRGGASASPAAPQVPAPAPRMAPSLGGLVGPRPVTPQAKAVAAATAETSTPATPVSDTPVSFTAETLADKWERCCAFVADRNVALPLILASVKPTEIHGNVVTLACSFSFHAEALDEAKNKRLVEEAIAAVMLEPVIVKFVVQTAPVDDAASELAEAFGGQVMG